MANNRLHGRMRSQHAGEMSWSIHRCLYLISLTAVSATCEGVDLILTQEGWISCRGQHASPYKHFTGGAGLAIVQGICWCEYAGARMCAWVCTLGLLELMWCQVDV